MLDENAGSSPADVTVEPSPTPDAKPAEALKTDEKVSEAVPYSRFKEVNDAKREYEEKLKSYEKVNPELYDSYSKFDELLGSNPQLAEKVKEIIVSGLAPQQQAHPQYQGPSDYQRMAYDNYTRDFETLMESEGIPTEQKERVFTLVSQEALKANPYALNRYDPKLVGKAYAGVKSLFDGIRQKERESYVKDKQKDDVPASGSETGSAPRKVQKFHSREERIAYMKEHLRAGS
jgi:hypothetical protein